MNSPRNSILQRDQRQSNLLRQGSLPPSALPLVPGCRKLLSWAISGSDGLFNVVDCIHLFPTRCHNRKPLLQRAGSGFKVQSLFLPSIAAAVTRLADWHLVGKTYFSTVGHRSYISQYQSAIMFDTKNSLPLPPPTTTSTATTDITTCSKPPQ